MDMVLTAVERTALPKQRLYSEFVGGSMIGIHFGAGICYSPPASPAASGERAALVRKKKGSLVRKRVKASFDPKIFLAKVGEGKTISKYRKDQAVFSQGQVADAVFYIQQGEIKLTVVSSRARKRWLQSWDPGTFLV